MQLASISYTEAPHKNYHKPSESPPDLFTILYSKSKRHKDICNTRIAEWRASITECSDDHFYIKVRKNLLKRKIVEFLKF